MLIKARNLTAFAVLSNCWLYIYSKSEKIKLYSKIEEKYVIAKSLSFVRSNIAKLSVVVFFTLLLSLGGTWLAPMVASSAPLASANCQPVEIGKIYRFLEGQDTCLMPMSDSDIEQLTDPFAKDVLRQGNYPRSAKGINQTIKAKLGY